MKPLALIPLLSLPLCCLSHSKPAASSATVDDADRIAELDRKWGTDVTTERFCTGVRNANASCVVGLFGDINFCAFTARALSDRAECTV
jgi:hypothetical protein